MATPRSNTESELQALFDVARTLAGFDERVSFEWLDGAMTAIVGGPRLPEFDEWTTALLGDALQRAFADPADAARARAALQARWDVLVSQLYSEALVDDPDELRLTPQLHDYGGVDAPADDLPRLGEVWAQGFGDALEAFHDEWVEPDPDTEVGGWFAGCLDRISALMLDDDGLKAHLDEYYEGRPLGRDDLLDEACYAVQDLRVYWSELQAPPPPRRVEKTPGRNDPCPCGSGKKYKKCHGAAA